MIRSSKARYKVSWGDDTGQRPGSTGANYARFADPSNIGLTLRSGVDYPLPRQEAAPEDRFGVMHKGI